MEIKFHDLSQRTSNGHKILFSIWSTLLQCKFDQQFCRVWSIHFQSVIPSMEIVAYGLYDLNMATKLIDLP